MSEIANGQPAEVRSPAYWATATLLLGLVCPVLLIVTAILEFGLSGGGILVSSPEPPAPFYLRLITLIPFWGCIGATFYCTLREGRETAPALLMLVFGLLFAIGAGFFGLYLTGWALFPSHP